MNRKNNLLSIGEISKLTGASVKSLRYYERINILKPAYISPDSGYRYYSFNQTYLIGLIMFAIELDIPLKELSKFIAGQDTLDFKAFGAYGKKAAQEKIKKLQNGLKFIDFFEQKMIQHERYPVNSIYTREISEKYFSVIPYEKTFENVDQSEVTKLLLNIPHNEDDYNELPEHGLLCEHSSDGVSRYVFLEMPQDQPKLNCKIIPAGKYYCIQSDAGQTEQAKEIFGDYLADKDSFIIIEVEAFLSKININKPMNELRVLLL